MTPRKKVFPPSSDPKKERAAEHIFDHLCRHVVCLTIRYTLLDNRGKAYGKERFLAYSGFVMSINGIWSLVTAGHVLKSLDDYLANKQIKIVSCSLVDYFGKGAAVRSPTPFPIEDTPKAYIDDADLGLDIGLIYLRPLIQQGLEANHILPIREENWVRQHTVEFQAYTLLGFPSELVNQHTKPVDPGEPMNAVVAPVIIGTKRIENPDTELPSSVKIPPSKFPWFIGQLIPPQTPNIVGMSGGPIFGLRGTSDGGLRYWVVAMQSRWFEQCRIILGCPVPIFADLVSQAMYRP